MNALKPILILIFSFLTCTNPLFGQLDSLVFDQNNEQLNLLDYENLMEQSGDEIDLSEEQNLMIEREQFNINDLSVDMAIGKIEMTDYQYYQLLKYIDQCGPLVTIYELAAIEGFHYQEIVKWLPYLKVGPIKKGRFKFKELFTHSNHQLLIRNSRVLEEKKGYLPEIPNGYAGSPDRLSFKYVFQSKDRISFGIAGEKDAGEQFFRGEQKKGFDWYSFHFQVKKMGLLKKVIIGDYRMQMAQGVIMGSGYLQGSGIGIRKIQSTIQPVTAMNESPLNCGIVAEIGNHKISGTLFWGSRYDIEGIQGHLYGSEVQFQTRLLKMGFRFIQMKYNDTILPSEKWYQLFHFHGIKNTNYGFDYRYILGHAILFGELGVSQSGGYGLIQGVIYPVHPMVKMVLMYRKYSANFHSIAGNGFSKNSTLQNEQGIYLASKLIVSRNTEWELFSDCYRIEWLKYLLDKPEPQLDIGSKYKWNISRNGVLLLQYRYKTAAQNDANGYYNEIHHHISHRVKCVIQSQPHPMIRLKTEVNISIYQTPIFDFLDQETFQKGILLYQDVGISWEKPKLQIWGRIAYFDTDSYDVRLYAYENDLTYCFTINSYYDQGFRWYLMVKYRIWSIDFQLRISRTLYDNKSLIGSGLEEIQGNSKTEIKGQVILKL